MQWFVDSPLLTLFFCVGVGSIFGRIRFGPVSFGPAGALFVALALSAIEPDVALPPIVTSLSLCVFCYMVGIAAGPSFVNALRTGWQPVVVSVIAIVAMAAAALGVGALFDLDIGTVAGAFSGAGHGHRGARCGAAAAGRRRGDPARTGDRLRGRLSDHGVADHPGLLVSDQRRPPQTDRRGPASRSRRSWCARWNWSAIRT